MSRAAYQLCKGTVSRDSGAGSQEEDEALEADRGPRLDVEALRRGRSVASVTSRFSRHPSLRVPTRALPSLVRDEQ